MTTYAIDHSSPTLAPRSLEPVGPRQLTADLLRARLGNVDHSALAERIRIAALD